MEKSLVKLPKEVAEDLQRRRNEGWTDFRIITYIYQQWDKGEAYSPMAEFADQYNNPFLRALADGYEVEETPKDKVMKLFETPNIQLVNPESYRMGITHALNALNIKIEGINA